MRVQRRFGAGVSSNRSLFFLALLALGLALGAAPAVAAKRALVIGNDDYVHANWPDLTRARSDAKAISSALENAGFDVTLRMDRDRQAMLADMREFIRGVGRNDEVVLFFSGHGLRLDGRNYLAPTDARGDSRENARDDSVSLAEQLDRLRRRDPAISLVIIDACRNDPFPSYGRKASLPGLAGMSGLRGQLVMYAAGEGQVALDRLGDNDSDPNSVFTRVLLREMARQRGPIQTLALKVRREVYALAQRIGHEQSPAIYDETLPSANMALAAAEVLPSERVLDLDDLRLRQEWASWQTRMASDFERVSALTDARLQVEGWSRFLSGYPQDNPYSDQDERLRREAGERTRRVEQQLPSGADDKLAGPMLRIEPGCFMMGSPASEAGRDADERQHRVCVDGFEIGKFEVAQRQWQAIMGSNPSRLECADCPVEYVNWHDAMAFIEKLNARTGWRFRLPTEAEWEYVARAGTTTPFHTGERISPSQANFDGRSTYNGSAKGVFRQKMMPVGGFGANAWGLHDVHGNVWEWTCSGYDRGYGGGELKCADGAAQYVVRGGGWSFYARNARLASRDKYPPTSRSNDLGFRLARTLP